MMCGIAVSFLKTALMMRSVSSIKSQAAKNINIFMIVNCLNLKNVNYLMIKFSNYDAS